MNRLELKTLLRRVRFPGGWQRRRLEARTTGHFQTRGSSPILHHDCAAKRRSRLFPPLTCLKRVNRGSRIFSLPSPWKPAEFCLRVYLSGIQSGRSRFYLEQAIERLGATQDLTVGHLSSFFENSAVGGPSDSPPFLNAAAEIKTSLTPRRLLDRLLEIERDLGRQRREKWGPRNIDLDLLLYGDQVIHEQGLTVPHPLMQRRRFVMQPLAEIAPRLRHPVLGKTMLELLPFIPST